MRGLIEAFAAAELQPVAQAVSCVDQVETVLDDVDEGVGRVRVVVQRDTPHRDGKNVHAYPENPLLHVSGTHQELPDNVANKRQHVENNGGFQESGGRGFVKLRDYEVRYDGAGKEYSCRQPALSWFEPAGLDAAFFVISAAFPLEEPDELHGYEIHEMQHRVAQAGTAVLPVNQAHGTVDGYVQQSEQEGDNLTVGGSNRCGHSHQCTECRNQQKSPRLRLCASDLQGGRQNRHHRHPNQDEGREVFVEDFVIHVANILIKAQCSPILCRAGGRRFLCGGPEPGGALKGRAYKTRFA